jgi:small subunit ribosomal protein S17
MDEKQIPQVNNKKQRIFTGVVVSDKMDKTIVVLVTRTKVHKKYKKRYLVSKKYKVHDEKNAYHTGDRVRFIESRPLSRHKRWRVIGSADKQTKNN